MQRANGKRPSTSVPPMSKRSSTAYSAEQRERLQHGLRILARMIVRAHLCREASRAVSVPTEPPSERAARG